MVRLHTAFRLDHTVGPFEDFFEAPSRWESLLPQWSEAPPTTLLFLPFPLPAAAAFSFAPRWKSFCSGRFRAVLASPTRLRGAGNPLHSRKTSSGEKGKVERRWENMPHSLEGKVGEFLAALGSLKSPQWLPKHNLPAPVGYGQRLGGGSGQPCSIACCSHVPLCQTLDIGLEFFLCIHFVVQCFCI